MVKWFFGDVEELPYECAEFLETNPDDTPMVQDMRKSPQYIKDISKNREGIKVVTL